MGRGLDRAAVETEWESDHKLKIIMKMTNTTSKHHHTSTKDIMGWNNKNAHLPTITFEGPCMLQLARESCTCTCIFTCMYMYMTCSDHMLSITIVHGRQKI